MTTQQTKTIELSQAIEIPWNLLRKGEANVRTVKPGNNEDDALIANIGETGVLLENLIVTPLKEHGTFGVHAGGRRWSAIGVNVKKGVLPDTFPVPCRVQTGGSLTAVSLAENLQAPMHPADEFAAFQQMQNDGLSVEDIAFQFGLPKQRVTQRLKLAQVAKRIVNAYRRDDINLNAVMAFTVASSQKQQLEVFKELEGRCHASLIKRALTGETIDSDDRLVRFIGLKSYTSEGGTIVADLFSEHDHLQDRELVERLAMRKLQKKAARLTKTGGWKNVEVTTDQYFGTHDYFRIEPPLVHAPAELSERLKNLSQEHKELIALDDWTEEQEAKEAQLDDAIRKTEADIDAYRQYTDEQKAIALCFITVNYAGKAVISRGYITRSEARKAETKVKGKKEDSSVTKAIPKALINDLGVHRQQVAKVALLGDPALANDVLLYTLCHEILSTGYSSKTLDARIEAVQPHAHDEKFMQDKSTDQLNTVHGKLSTEWLTIDSPKTRFAAFRKLTSKRKQALMAYCVSASFIADLDSGNDNISEAVLQELQPNYADFWRPTGDEYFKRLTLSALIDLGTELFGEKWQVEHNKDKKKDLVVWFDNFFVGPLKKGVSDDLKEIRENWLPAGFVRTIP